MTQPSTEFAPPETAETTVMTVWPSIAATPLGQRLGGLYAVRIGVGWLTVGKLIALASIPLVLPLYFAMLDPWRSRRYRLTNRRVIIERGVAGEAERAIGLTEFESVDIVVLPGQAWYPAGDLVFRREGLEVFRLPGVPRPEGFQQTILKTARAYAGLAVQAH
jgi:hypothetical protein